jgi:hypothetical protein
LQNLENETVEALVQRLEAMEKYNEQYKRENQLFESYLLRKQKENLWSEQEIQDKEKKMK